MTKVYFNLMTENGNRDFNNEATYELTDGQLNALLSSDVIMYPVRTSSNSATIKQFGIRNKTFDLSNSHEPTLKITLKQLETDHIPNVELKMKD